MWGRPFFYEIIGIRIIRDNDCYNNNVHDKTGNYDEKGHTVAVMIRFHLSLTMKDARFSILIYTHLR